MREIKFRAWDKKLKSMAKVISLSFYEEGSDYKGNETESFLYYEKLDSTNLRPFEDIELMQYTGLKDKNGVEIFEGDIIEYFYGCRFKVAFKDFLFGWVEGEFIPFANMAKSEFLNFKVIGNIYENKELLEGK